MKYTVVTGKPGEMKRRVFSDFEKADSLYGENTDAALLENNVVAKIKIGGEEFKIGDNARIKEEYSDYGEIGMYVLREVDDISQKGYIVPLDTTDWRYQNEWIDLKNIYALPRRVRPRGKKRMAVNFWSGDTFYGYDGVKYRIREVLEQNLDGTSVVSLICDNGERLNFLADTMLCIGN